MNKKELFAEILKKKSFLCVGLDTDLEKIPKFLLDKKDPIFEFNKEIIDATSDFTVAYKPNIAFYEAYGLKGFESLKKTVNYIKKNFPNIFVIADAKRGDIGNTSKMYAKAFFENMNFDAITVNPYMGKDSVKPFFVKNKWLIILALTSNSGAFDFQFFENEKKEKLFEKVLKTSKNWGDENNLMYVVGATKSKNLEKIRKIIPNHFLLVPGVGKQGGSLEEVAKFGMNKECSLLVNSSRGIIFADNTKNFSKIAREKAKELQNSMQNLLSKYLF